MDWTAVLTPSIGSAGLLAIAVIMIMTGRLVPKATLDEMRADKDRQITTWQATCEKLREANLLKDRQINALLDASRTTTRVIAALPQALSDNEGGSHAALAEAEE